MTDDFVGLHYDGFPGWDPVGMLERSQVDVHLLGVQLDFAGRRRMLEKAWSHLKQLHVRSQWPQTLQVLGSSMRMEMYGT